MLTGSWTICWRVRGRLDILEVGQIDGVREEHDRKLYELTMLTIEMSLTENAVILPTFGFLDFDFLDFDDINCTTYVNVKNNR